VYPWRDVDIKATLKLHPDAPQTVVEAITEYEMKSVDGSSTEFRHDRAVQASDVFIRRIFRPCTE
jgi:hypothetical protein